MTTTARFCKEQTVSIFHGNTAAVALGIWLTNNDNDNNNGGDDNDDDDDDDENDDDMTWCSWSRDNDEIVQYWKHCFVDTYTNKLYLSLLESRWTHIHCLVLRSKTNNLQLIKLTESAIYSVHSDKNEEKMTHWTRYCATASFVYHSGKPILTLNLSPSRQSELLVGRTVKSLYKHTYKIDSSLNEHRASVPNIFLTALDSLMVAMVSVLNKVDCKAVVVGHASEGILKISSSGKIL